MTINRAFHSLVYFLTERFHSVTIHVPNKTLIISTTSLNNDLYIERTANKSFIVRRYVNRLWDGSEGQCPTVKSLQDCLIAMGAAQIPHAKCYL